jgi:hypothetical protein
MRSIRRRLRAVLDGRVITPGDADYNQARTVFYGMFDPPAGGHRPARRPKRCVAGGVAGA